MKRTLSHTSRAAAPGRLHGSLGTALLCGFGLGCDWAYQWADTFKRGRTSMPESIQIIERIYGVLPETVNLDQPIQRGRYRLSLLPT